MLKLKAIALLACLLLSVQLAVAASKPILELGYDQAKGEFVNRAASGWRIKAENAPGHTPRRA